MATVQDAPYGVLTDDGERVCKLGLCGNSGVGKSSIHRRLAGEPFREHHQTTLAPDFAIVKREMPDKRVVRITVWDTVGMERCKALSALSFRGAHAIVGVYDITDRNSYDDALDWIARAQRVCGTIDPYIILVGNKVDLAETARAVTIDEARLLCEQWNFCAMEVSALDMTGVDELAMALCAEIHERYTRWRKQLRGSKIAPPRALPKSEALNIIDPLNIVNKVTPRRMEPENAEWAAQRGTVDLSAVMAGGSRPVPRKPPPVSFWDRVSQMTCSN